MDEVYKQIVNIAKKYNTKLLIRASFIKFLLRTWQKRKQQRQLLIILDKHHLMFFVWM